MEQFLVQARPIIEILSSRYTTIDLKAGDYIDYRIQQTIGGALFASAAHCWINIEKVK